MTRPNPIRFLIQAAVIAIGLPILTISPAFARTVVNCAGAALAGGAQLICSHVDQRSPAQLCTYSWALATMSNDTQVVEGTFLITPGASNVTIYQAAGFSHAMSNPIVMCQGKRRGATQR